MLDEAAAAVCLAVVGQVRPDQLDLPTPCTQWSLGELLAHQVAENRGFAANVINPPGAVNPEIWQPGRPETALEDFAESVNLVTGAFRIADLEAPVEVREFGVFPARVAIAMHFVDYLAHSWDIARAIGLADPMPPRLAEAAIQYAALIPADRPDGSAFAPVVAIAEDTSANDKFLGLTGRDPGWTSGEVNS
ncbi:TIGR03086 family metal-binding protein [Kribbella flavida]|uniref:TIGR03086 family metal-binding protein n=1 Tax=Kribbella flavida TaxID=182640 RepID=UPI00019BEF9E|nr:TIGR03086 family metal-binding protein [Kribbella flavida]